MWSVPGLHRFLQLLNGSHMFVIVSPTLISWRRQTGVVASVSAWAWRALLVVPPPVWRWQNTKAIARELLPGSGFDRSLTTVTPGQYVTDVNTVGAVNRNATIQWATTARRILQADANLGPRLNNASYLELVPFPASERDRPSIRRPFGFPQTLPKVSPCGRPTPDVRAVEPVLF